LCTASHQAWHCRLLALGAVAMAEQMDDVDDAAIMLEIASSYCNLAEWVSIRHAALAQSAAGNLDDRVGLRVSAGGLDVNDAVDHAGALLHAVATS
jgi:hypothetical protein